MTRNVVIGIVAALALFAFALLFVGPGQDGDPVQAGGAGVEQTADAAGATPTTSAQTPTTQRDTTTSAAPEVSAELIPTGEIESAAVEVVGTPTEEGIIVLARSMAATGDPRWVPYLLDLRLLSTEVVFAEVVGALETLTGEPAPDDPRASYLAFGRWMYNNEVDAGQGYIRWKAQLFSLIDPLMGSAVASVEDPVLAAQVQWGGVRVGGIPELNDQATLSIAAADYMLEDELTFGAVVNGQARAYPHRILDHHELANDTLGGEAVALVNCTLCRTGVLYSREVGGRVLEFITSGLLHNSNKVMMDRQTRSLWFQLSGEAIAGEFAGTVLERLPLTVARYGEWTAEHPDSDVVSIPDGFAYSYQPGDAYAEYYGSPDLWFPTFEVPDVFDPKAEVATVDLAGAQLAVSVDALVAAGPQVIPLGEATLAALPTAAGARFYLVPLRSAALDARGLVAALEAGDVNEDRIDVSGEAWPRVVSAQSFWFAWYGNYPATTWWPPAQ